LEDLKKNNLEYISKEDPRRRTLKLSQKKKVTKKEKEVKMRSKLYSLK